jgi:hypothetical protein
LTVNPLYEGQGEIESATEESADLSNDGRLRMLADATAIRALEARVQLQETKLARLQWLVIALLLACLPA